MSSLSAHATTGGLDHTVGHIESTCSGLIRHDGMQLSQFTFNLDSLDGAQPRGEKGKKTADFLFHTTLRLTKKVMKLESTCTV